MLKTRKTRLKMWQVGWDIFCKDCQTNLLQIILPIIPSFWVQCYKKIWSVIYTFVKYVWVTETGRKSSLPLKVRLVRNLTEWSNFCLTRKNWARLDIFASVTQPCLSCQSANYTAKKSFKTFFYKLCFKWFWTCNVEIQKTN